MLGVGIGAGVGGEARHEMHLEPVDRLQYPVSAIIAAEWSPTSGGKMPAGVSTMQALGSCAEEMSRVQFARSNEL